jgi:NAD-dependent dihydropyrimidine dehydrogenase PreA subunit
MTFFIGAACTDLKDRSCVEVCPVDCIYEGPRRLYINPNECIDCGACESVCPVEAVGSDRVLFDDDEIYLVDNARFFADPLPGRNQPLGDPGGASSVGPIGVDTELASAAATNA